MDKDTRLIFSISTKPGNRGMLIHNALFKKHGLNYLYKSLSVSPENFQTAFHGMHAFGVSGCSVSMPYKVQAAHLCTTLVGDAGILGVVNTLLRTEHGFFGYNTDVAGAEHALRNFFEIRSGSVVLLGAGATAHSVVLALSRLGVGKIRCWNRNKERLNSLRHLCSSLGISFLASPLPCTYSADILINATSCEMGEELISAKELMKYAAVFDVNVDQTCLIKNAKSVGLKNMTGELMATHQSLLQFEIYTGHNIDFAVEHQYLESIL